jgi:myosin heavy subunit
MKIKNNDNLNDDFCLISSLTTDENIRQILDKGEKHINGIMRTSKFQKGLNDILADIEKTHCHIIYCIKPNEDKRKGNLIRD